jgi:hypothetical protein
LLGDTAAADKKRAIFASIQAKQREEYARSFVENKSPKKDQGVLRTGKF